MTTAEYSPTEFVYKQYGDLKVFRCGDEVRLFGVILEQLAVFDGFDHLVIVLEVSEHDYDQAGVTRGQAQELQETFASIDTRTEFREELTGAVFGSDQIDAIFESEKAESARSWIDQL